VTLSPPLIFLRLPMDEILSCIHCQQMGLMPWTTCFSGKHIMCHVCERVREKSCPGCSETWRGSQEDMNMTEKVAIHMGLTLHCSYPGCTWTTPAAQNREAMETHFRTCPRRIIRCVYEGRSACPWSGTPADFFSLDESYWTFLPMNAKDKIYKATVQLLSVAPKRPREEETHTSRKKAKKE
jgi:hypothetical protein